VCLYQQLLKQYLRCLASQHLRCLASQCLHLVSPHQPLGRLHYLLGSLLLWQVQLRQHLDSLPQLPVSQLCLLVSQQQHLASLPQHLEPLGGLLQQPQLVQPQVSPVCGMLLLHLLILLQGYVLSVSCYVWSLWRVDMQLNMNLLAHKDKDSHLQLEAAMLPAIKRDSCKAAGFMLSPMRLLINHTGAPSTGLAFGVGSAAPAASGAFQFPGTPSSTPASTASAAASAPFALAISTPLPSTAAASAPLSFGIAASAAASTPALLSGTAAAPASSHLTGFKFGSVEAQSSVPSTPAPGTLHATY